MIRPVELPQVALTGARGRYREAQRRYKEGSKEVQGRCKGGTGKYREDTREVLQGKYREGAREVQRVVQGSTHTGL